MIAGARWRSSIVSNSGTIGSVQLSTPGASAKRPACLASRYAPSTSLGAPGHARARSCRTPRGRSPRAAGGPAGTCPSVSAASAGSSTGGAPRPPAGGPAPPAIQPRHASGSAGGAAPPSAATPLQRAQRGVELGGVLPHVEPHGAEPERLHLPPHRPHQRARRAPRRPPSTSSALDQPEVGDQRVGRGVAGGIRSSVSPRSVARIMTSSRRSMQARYWRKISPGLRPAIASPSPVAASSRSSAWRKRSDDRDAPAR